MRAARIETPQSLSKTVAAEIAALGGGRGNGVLVVDDLVDTGQTSRGGGESRSV
jgi:adenine/guanine phosphoribosyltransferase-like PRPP-binding protein